MSNLIESYSQIFSSLIVSFSSVFFYLVFHYLHKKKIQNIIITSKIAYQGMSLVNAIVLSIIGVLCVLNTNYWEKFNTYTFFSNYFIIGYCISHWYIEYKHDLLKLEMILHHFLTIYLCSYSIYYYESSYINNVSNGLGHIPNIFLCNYKILQQLPDYKKKYFYRYNQILFAMTFFIFKFFGYTYLCVYYLNTIPFTHQIIFVTLTILQYYWGYLICKKVLNVLQIKT